MCDKVTKLQYLHYDNHFPIMMPNFVIAAIVYKKQRCTNDQKQTNCSDFVLEVTYSPSEIIQVHTKKNFN